MSKVTIIDRGRPTSVVMSNEIEVGTIFTGSIENNSNGSLFLATYNKYDSSIPLIIDLRNRTKTWENIVGIANYMEVDIAITINR
jgi:hypothetical protein